MRIFGSTAGFDHVGSISLIYTVVKLTRVTCRYNLRIHIFAPCSKDVAHVAEVVGATQVLFLGSRVRLLWHAINIFDNFPCILGL